MLQSKSINMWKYCQSKVQGSRTGSARFSVISRQIETNKFAIKTANLKIHSVEDVENEAEREAEEEGEEDEDTADILTTENLNNVLRVLEANTKYAYTMRKNSRLLKKKQHIDWIERLLQMPLQEHRKYSIWRISIYIA
jgi:hypothetical protein